MFKKKPRFFIPSGRFGIWVFSDLTIQWELHYSKHVPQILGEKGSDPHCVAGYMNESFTSQRKGIQANERVTIVTEGVEHILSRYDSIKGTKNKLLLFISTR